MVTPDRNSMAELKWQQTVDDLLDSLAPYQRTLMGLLAISHVTNRPPAKSLNALGCELPGRLAYDLFDLSESLEQGNELFKTLEQYPRLVPPQAAVLLRLARDEGMLDYVYSRINQRFPRLNRARESAVGGGISLFMKSCFIVLVITFILLKVAPELSKIHQEFGLEATRFNLSLNLADRLIQWLSLPLMILVLLILAYAILWTLVRAVMVLFRGSRPWQHQAVSSSVTRKRFLAALAHSGGLGHLLERFSSSTSFNRLLPRLNAVRNRLAQGGVSAWSALADQRLISRGEARLIESADPETQAWLMRWKAASQERKIHRNRTIWGRAGWITVQCLSVFVVLLMSMLVLGSLVDIMHGLIQDAV